MHGKPHQEQDQATDGFPAFCSVGRSLLILLVTIEPDRWRPQQNSAYRPVFFYIMTRTGFTRHRHKAKKLILSTAFIAVIIILGAALYRGADMFHRRTEQKNDTTTISQLWDEGRYAEVALTAEDILSKNQMDRNALLYAGYSRFFLAISRISAEERTQDLDRSIKYLRLLKVRGDTPNPERVDYVLGKAYLLKGRYWADLAVKYLLSSLDGGYKAEDSYEFIGRGYSEMGDSERALEWYERAADDHPTDKLLLTLGQEAFSLGLYDQAARFYRRMIDETKDESLKKRGLSQLGQLYYDVGNYAMARGVLERLVELEPRDANYRFLLGETYYELGMDAEARRSWLAVTRIDPEHVGALRRLYD